MRKSKNHLTVVKTEAHGFFELARAHVAGHGGEWFVVDKRQALSQWRTWIAYFAWLDDQTTPRGHKASTFRTLEKLTVPTEWPIDFDVSAPPAQLPEPREEMPSPERRRQLAKMLLEVVAGFAPSETPRAKPKPFTAPVNEEKPLFADRPVVNTAALANYLADMRAKQDETAMKGDEAWARAEGQSR